MGHLERKPLKSSTRHRKLCLAGQGEGKTRLVDPEDDDRHHQKLPTSFNATFRRFTTKARRQALQYNNAFYIARRSTMSCFEDFGHGKVRERSICCMKLCYSNLGLGPLVWRTPQTDRVPKGAAIEASASHTRNFVQGTDTIGFY